MTHAENILHSVLQDIAQEKGFSDIIEVSPMNTDGANYTSHLYTATLSNGVNKLKLFGKVAALGEKLRSKLPMKVYETELFFYKDLLKSYRLLEEKNTITEEHKLKAPQFHGFNDKLYEETIVLENLTMKDFKQFDRFTTITWEYAALAVKELAKFHALSVAYQIYDPEGFEKVVKKLKFDSSHGDMAKVYWNRVINSAVQVTKEENRGKLKRFLEKSILEKYSFGKFYEKLRLGVIGHGDYRPSNLMHRIHEDGSVEVIPVDYQTLRVGSPVMDLFYFIFTGSDGNFRAQYFDQLTAHYYSELRAAFTRLGLNPDQVYSEEDYKFELKKKLPFGLALAVISLPIITVEAENAPKVDEDMDMNSFNVMKTGELYPVRLNEVVDDFVRWGVL